MKKALCLIFLLLLGAFLFSCEGAHTHQFEDSWTSDATHHWKRCADASCTGTVAKTEHSFAAQEGQEGESCSVCGEQRILHTHAFAAEWTANATHHWHVCTDKACGAAEQMLEHQWGEPTVVTPPTSQQEGVARYLCTDCGISKNENIASLPAKMSREDWESAFAFDNVQIENTSKMGSLGTTKQTYLVDGEQVELREPSLGSVFSDRSVLTEIDFSDKYEDFVHLGEGVYMAASLTVYIDGIYCDYLDCKITFVDGKISEITYAMEMAFLGRITDSFTFSSWGEVEIVVPVLDDEMLDAALSIARFSQNFTLYKETYGEDSYTGTEICVVGDIYTFETTDMRGTVTDSGYAPSEGLAAQLVAEMRAITDKVELCDFQYDTYQGFVCKEKIENFDGKGNDLLAVSLLVEEGYLLTFSYEISDGTTVSYGFSDYADMPDYDEEQEAAV